MFPNFNSYSTPLLILALQGLIFAMLLIRRYFKKAEQLHDCSALINKFIPLIICIGYLELDT